MAVLDIDKLRVDEIRAQVPIGLQTSSDGFAEHTSHIAVGNGIVSR